MRTNPSRAGSDRPLPAARAPGRCPPAPRKRPTVLAVAPSSSPDHLLRRLLARYLRGACEIAVEERPRLSEPTLRAVRIFEHRTLDPMVVVAGNDRATLLLRPPPALPRPPEAWAALGRRVVAFHREVGGVGRIATPFEDERWAEEGEKIEALAWSLERGSFVQLSRDLSVEGFDPRTWTVLRALERVARAGVDLARAVPLGSSTGPASRTLRTVELVHAAGIDLLERALDGTEPDDVDELLDVAVALRTSSAVVLASLGPAVGREDLDGASAAALGIRLGAVDATLGGVQEILEAAETVAEEPPRRGGGVAPGPNVVRTTGGTPHGRRGLYAASSRSFPDRSDGEA